MAKDKRSKVSISEAPPSSYVPMPNKNRQQSQLIGLLVFIIAFLTFTSNKSFFIASDTRGITSVANWLGQGNGLSLNTHPAYQTEAKTIGYWAQRLDDGKIVSIYPVTASITAAPFYWLAYQIGYSRSVAEEGQLAKWIASLMIAFAVWCSWIILLRLYNTKTALTLCGLLTFGSPYFSTLSQSLWMQTPAIFCQAISLVLALNWLFPQAAPAPDRPKLWQFAALFSCGFFSAWSAACRPNFAIWTILLLGACIYKLRWHRSAVAIAGAALATGMWAGINLLTYGTISGLYSSKAGDVGFGNGLMPALTGLAAILVSPGRGLFIFCPWTIFILAGLFMCFKRNNHGIGNLISATFVLITILLIGFFGQWWGGWSNGPRLQSDILIPGAIIAGLAIRPLLSRRAGFLVPLILFIPSALIQFNASRMLNYYWEEFAGKTRKDIVQAYWDWPMGNYHWIWAQGEFERELRGDSGDPVVPHLPFTFPTTYPDAKVFIQNGFYLDENRAGMLLCRARQARLVFSPNEVPDGIIQLELTCGDYGTWGAFHTTRIKINKLPVGSFSRLSGSAPTHHTITIPAGLIKPHQINEILFEEKQPAKEGGGDAFNFYSRITLAPATATGIAQ